ncbi:MAG: ComEC/Rec2 family competence protein [Holosporales bacterium]|jgi:competence protein ComEC|nr:ComEC/Rec2 family competence protein [Holosporales bacterium]
MAEFEIHRWRLCYPVFLSLGIALYFSLNKEPSNSLIYVFISLLLLFLFLIKEIKEYLKKTTKYVNSLTWLILGIQLTICVVVGFSAAKIRTFCVNTPHFSKEIPHITLDGIIESIEDVPRGTLKRPRIVRRLILSDVKGKGLSVARKNSNFKIRVQGPFKMLQKAEPMARIKLEAKIFPPPPPITMSGYNARFDAYFRGISAFGRLKNVEKIYEPKKIKESKINEKISKKIQKIRFFIKNKTSDFLSEDVMPIAGALTIGDKSGISIKTRENYTKSGISHILAISGLHMGLLTFIIFLIITKILVLIPRFAEKFSVMKIAAALTIPVALFYLLLSGVSFSAMRAFLMVCISMIAILINERPISLYSVAIAAIVILITFPESLYSVSFQLSFASVTGLCYFYEKHNNFTIKFANTYNIFKFFSPIFNAIKQSIFSTLIATIATTPIIIYTFQRFTFVGVLGNLLAIPLLSLFIMPVGILAMFSLFWGGFAPFFSLFQFGLKLLNFVAERIGAIPFSDFLVVKPSTFSVVLIILSALWLMIWNERSKRLIGLPFLLYGGWLFFHPVVPTVFLMQKVIGVKGNDRFLISSNRFGGFHAKVWSQECGLKNVEEMKLEEVKELENKFEEEIGIIEKEEVLFLFRKKQFLELKELNLLKKKDFWAQKLSFKEKYRPFT